MLRVAGLVSLFEGRDLVFEGKIGFESMDWMRDAEKNHRDYGICIGSG